MDPNNTEYKKIETIVLQVGELYDIAGNREKFVSAIKWSLDYLIEKKFNLFNKKDELNFTKALKDFFEKA